jgi:hypothetical protein
VGPIAGVGKPLFGSSFFLSHATKRSAFAVSKIAFKATQPP